MSTTQNTARTALAVDQGAQHLDDVCPGWEQLIALDRLHMGDPRWCILGQIASAITGKDLAKGYQLVVHPSERLGLKHADELAALDVTGWFQSSALGFDRVSPAGVVIHSHEDLMTAWRDEILDRLEEWT